MTDKKVIDALEAVTNSLVKTVQGIYPGYPEEQMLVAPEMTVSDVRKLIVEASK